MTILLVAHGTRNPHGVSMISDLAAAVSAQLAETVRVAFVDVLGPTPSEVLADMTGEPVIVVPAFLSAGHHVRVDIPTHVRASGHDDATVTPALGPSVELAHVLRDRIHARGIQTSGVVLAAAGSSDPRAQRDIRAMARTLGTLTGTPVRVGYAAPPANDPGRTVAEAVARLRAEGHRGVAVASYLLADGLFQRRLHDSGADVVTDPLGSHSAVVELICARVSRARVDTRV